MQNTEEREIRIRIIEHKATGLLAGISDDLHGLVVLGESPEQIESRIDGAVRDILQAQGFQVLTIESRPDNREASAGFGLPAFIASASLLDGHT